MARAAGRPEGAVPPAGAWRGRVWALLTTDAALLLASVPAAHALRVWVLAPVLPRAIQPLADYAAPGAVVAGIALLSLAFARLYEDRRYLSRLLEYAAIAKAVAYAMLAALALTVFLKAFQYSRGLLVTYWAVATLAVTAGRSAWHQVIKAMRRRGRDALPVAVLTAGAGAGRVEVLLRRFPELGYRAVARVPVAARPEPGLERLEALVRTGRVAGVLVAAADRDYQRVVPYLAWCEERYLPHHRLTRAFDAMTGGGVEPGGLPPVEPKPFYTAAKRAFDESAALVLLTLSCPLWLAIVFLVKLDSPGPVFFVQDRVGRHGRLFRLVKFRTMYVHAPRYATKARRTDDPRVTAVGRFLRRTSLDELPQLLNVLKGEMSLVGPRPEMPFMVARNTPEYRRRLMVLPGVTGLWQAVARHEPLEDSLKYDLYYLRHRSFAFDLVLLARTAISLLSGRGGT